MNRQSLPTPPGAFRRALQISTFALLLATAAAAAPQDIDITCMPAPAIHVINAVAGTPLAGQDIGVLNAAGNVFWDFSVAPAGCGAGPAFNCNGVTITLPPGSPGTSVSSAAKVAVAGTPTASGSFSFQLQVTADNGTGTPTCAREFHLVVTAPFDAVFVLDRSGSMAESSPPGSRWDALKAGVNNFTPLLSAPLVAPAGSRFGLTLFATAVLPNASFPAGLTPIDAGLAASVNTELTSQSPDGATAMGAGLKNGMGKMVDATRPRVVVLFTDGEQNQLPKVVDAGPDQGCKYTDGTLVNPTCPAGAGTVKIVTVGIGSPAGAYLTTLQSLATQNRGHYLSTGNGSTFADPLAVCSGDAGAAFSCAVQPALAGNSPQLTASAAGALTGTVSLPPFDLNRFVDQLLIEISLNRSFEVPQFVNVIAGLRIFKGSTDVTAFFQPTIVGNAPRSVLLRTRFGVAVTAGTLDPEGSYTIRWAAPAGPAGVAGLQFRLLAFADDHRLGLDWRVDPAAPRADQPFHPTVTLSWLSRPVTNATVEAVILKPGDDLGDLLARDPRKVDAAQGPDAGSPGLQKYNKLLADPAFLAKLLPAEQHLTLTHQGDGVYSAAFNPGDVSGVYQVLYRVSADDPAFGKLQRQPVQSVYVRFGTVDLAASAVTTTVRGNSVLINFRPVTKTGRFIGPANAATLAVAGAGIKVGSITDHQDGSYTVVLNGNPGAEVAISILGEEIYRGPASGFGLAPVPHDRCEHWPRWLRWLCRLFKGKGH